MLVLLLFGRSTGIWEGIVGALKLNVVFVTPTTWKKYYDGLIVPRMTKEEKLKYSTKELSKMKSAAKAQSKIKARETSKKLYPLLEDEFKLVNSDGKAEALLMAHYAKNNQDLLLMETTLEDEE